MLFRDERDMNQPKTPLKDPLMISNEAMEFFTNEDFVSIVMSNAYEPTDYGEALAHISQGNKKLSKKICRLILKGIAVSDYHKIDNYLKVVAKLLALKDKDEVSKQSL